MAMLNNQRVHWTELSRLIIFPTENAIRRDAQTIVETNPRVPRAIFSHLFWPSRKLKNHSLTMEPMGQEPNFHWMKYQRAQGTMAGSGKKPLASTSPLKQIKRDQRWNKKHTGQIDPQIDSQRNKWVQMHKSRQKCRLCVILSNAAIGPANLGDNHANPWHHQDW